MNYLKIFAAILMLLPLATYAGDNEHPITCKLGKNTKEINKSVNFEITIAELEKDAHLYIYSKDKKYTITGYEISVVLSGSRDLLGIFKKTDDDILKVLKDVNHTVAAGDRIFIENLQATCDGCAEPVTVKPMAIMVK